MMINYPIIISPTVDGGYIANIPDFNLTTPRVTDYGEAINTAKGMVLAAVADATKISKPLPAPSGSVVVSVFDVDADRCPIKDPQINRIFDDDISVERRPWLFDID